MTHPGCCSDGSPGCDRTCRTLDTIGRAAGPTPTRAGRAGDQPLPTAGTGDVLVELAVSLPGAVLERRRLGIERYGRALQLWNGRDAGKDLEDELLDALAYGRQLRQQHAELEREVVELRAEVARLRAGTGRS